LPHGNAFQMIYFGFVQGLVANVITIKSVYNGHPRDPKIVGFVAFVDDNLLSLFRGSFMQ